MAEAERIAIERARALANWYRNSIRGFLEEHAGDQLPHLDSEVERLDGAVSQDRDTVVCFVGPSAIGKSTLLNALVAGEKTLAPSGGVGPLTALATEVRYSDVPKLTAEFDPTRQLPVVVISETQDGSWSISPDVLARRTVGLAHIAKVLQPSANAQCVELSNACSGSTVVDRATTHGLDGYKIRPQVTPFPPECVVLRAAKIRILFIADDVAVLRGGAQRDQWPADRRQQLQPGSAARSRPGFDVPPPSVAV